MSVACRLELCAESIAPSSTCAQLQLMCILTMLVRRPGVGAQAGGRNGAGAAGSPIHTHTNPPASRQGYVRCLSRRSEPLEGGSDGRSTMLPSTSIFQP